MDEKFKYFSTKLIASVVQPTLKKPDHFSFISYESFKNYFKDLNNIFTINDLLLYSVSTKQIKREFFLNIIFDRYEPSKKPYFVCYKEGIDYEGKVFFKIIVNEVKKTAKETSSRVILDQDTNLVIPTYVGAHSLSADGNFDGQITDDTNPGFYMKRVKRILISIEENTTLYPKIKTFNSLIIDGFIYSIPVFFSPKRLIQPQFFTLNLDLSLKKPCFDIGSKSLFKMNIIILSAYLSGISINKLEEYIINFFQQNIDGKTIIYDEDAILNIKYIFEFTRQILYTYSAENEKIALHKYYTDNAKKENNSIFDIDELFPCVISFEEILKNCYSETQKVNLRIHKGFLILSIILNYLIGVNQKSIYPEKDSVLNKRILTPGLTFYKLSNDVLKNIKKICTAEAKSMLEEGRNVINASEKLNRSINQYIKNNLISTTSTVIPTSIKPGSKVSNTSAIKNIGNTVAKNRSKGPTANQKKDRDQSILEYTGPADTSDHGDKIRTDLSFSTGTTIGVKNFEQADMITKRILNYLFEHKLFIYIEKTTLKRGTCLIKFIIDSEYILGSVLQENCLELYKDIKKKKQKSLFLSPFISITLIPVYGTNKLNNHIPVEYYREIRISLGHKVPFNPYFIIKNGIPRISEAKINENDLNLPLDIFMSKYERCIEMLSPEETQFVQIIDSPITFLSYDISLRKKINYVGFDNILKLSLLEAQHVDGGKAKGERSIFSRNQVKSNINSADCGFLNSFELGKSAMGPFQDSFFTNEINEYSGASKQTYCTTTSVAYYSENNAEDSIEVSQSFASRYMIVIKNYPIKTVENLEQYSNDNYSYIDGDEYPYCNFDYNGSIKINSVVEPDSIITIQTKRRYNKSSDTIEDKDFSNIYSYTLAGRVEQISNDFVGEDNMSTIVIFCRQELCPGDKIADTCAQKSTISKIIPDHEMIYNIRGETPSVVANSISMASRQTFDVLVSALLNQYFLKMLIDGPLVYRAFSNISLYDIVNKLKKDLKKKYPEYSDEKIHEMTYCKQTFFNPKTKKNIPTKIFYFYNQYMRMTQIARENISGRDGLVFDQNMRPKGQREGEMENDSKKSAGVGNMEVEVYQDNLFIQKTTMFCINCMEPAIYFSDTVCSRYMCLKCENLGLSPPIKQFLLSRTAIKIFQLHQSLGIVMKIKERKNKTFYSSNSS